MKKLIIKIGFIVISTILIVVVFKFSVYTYQKYQNNKKIDFELRCRRISYETLDNWEEWEWQLFDKSVSKEDREWCRSYLIKRQEESKKTRALFEESEKRRKEKERLLKEKQDTIRNKYNGCNKDSDCIGVSMFTGCPADCVFTSINKIFIEKLKTELNIENAECPNLATPTLRPYLGSCIRAAEFKCEKKNVS
jgi:hypothetical protein